MDRSALFPHLFPSIRSPDPRAQCKGSIREEKQDQCAQPQIHRILDAEQQIVDEGEPNNSFCDPRAYVAHKVGIVLKYLKLTGFRIST